mgnify:CR=1 FL=1
MTSILSPDSFGALLEWRRGARNRSVGANDFDHAALHADADAYVLPEDLATIDMQEVEANFYVNVIN